MAKETENKTNEALREKLLSSPKHAARILKQEEIDTADRFCEDYKAFLNASKTEREAVIEIERRAVEHGYTKFVPGKKYEAGSRVYLNNRGKAVILAVIGKTCISEGMRIIAAHIDSPRIDLKPNPLYEDSELALFKTHYYGGIKKYQWTAIPLSLHGVVVKKDGASISVTIGEAEDEPGFVITDLLPHLGRAQSERKLGEGIKGEELNILIGSRPLAGDEGADSVKLNIMNILHEKYGIIESDFLSAELELVPAFLAKDIGFDRSMVASYGQDDRVCAYTSLIAALEVENPEKTCLTVLADKEEVGSNGNTGLDSSFMKYFIYDLAEASGIAGHTVLSRSECLSADVNAGFDPTFPEVMERRNAAFFNRGVVVTKYTGARGKSGTSDASAEFMGKVRRMLDGAGVVWQTGELGKVDEGGGGTVAMFVANLDVDVVDVGVPVLSMHSPYEVTAKLDVYMAYKAFQAFFV
ncbi:MAG: aminopeptidase [Oscillospiraceae bacterium]|nr:aminopeptidase [Oscillospiraceae bacterium]